MRRVRDPDGRVHLSSLKQMKISAAHYLYALTHPRTEISRPMTIGSISDALVFRNRKVVVYPGRRAGKEWDAFRFEHRRDVVCIESEYEDAAGAAEAVLRHPVAGPILANPKNEYQRVMAWEDWGLECGAGIAGEDGRGGFDILSPGWIYDLKVTNDSSPRALERQIFTMSWHCQGAFYVDGAAKLGMGPLDFALICVESTPPHPVTVVELTPDLLDIGRKSLSMWTERLKACEAADEWPEYVHEMIPMSVPDWYQSE